MTRALKKTDLMAPPAAEQVPIPRCTFWPPGQSSSSALCEALSVVVVSSALMMERSAQSVTEESGRTKKRRLTDESRVRVHPWNTPTASCRFFPRQRQTELGIKLIKRVAWQLLPAYLRNSHTFSKVKV